MWQLAGGRWHITGCRQQVAGSRWEVAGGRQQVAGGWQSSLIQTDDGIVGLIFGLTEKDPPKDRGQVLTSEKDREKDPGKVLTPKIDRKIDRDKVPGTEVRLCKSQEILTKHLGKQVKNKKFTLKMELSLRNRP